MEFTDLSLAPGLNQDMKSETSESERGLPFKRKWSSEAPSVDLQLQTPLPPHWEQCLDLQSGRMYRVNRETSGRKRGNGGAMEKGKEKVELDLELNMKPKETSKSMVALACSNCHLLVILCRSSPYCPNCKFAHSL